MGFQISIDGEVVKEVDVDPFLVNSVWVNGLHKIPVAGAQPELGLDLKIEYKTPTDGDVVARLRTAAATDLEDSLGIPTRTLSEAEQEAEDEKTAALEEMGKEQQEELERAEKDREGLSLASEDEDISSEADKAVFLDPENATPAPQNADNVGGTPSGGEVPTPEFEINE